MDFWDQADHLDAYGTSLRRRFQDTGNVTDISAAISAYQQAVQLTPDGHTDLPGRLSKLGNSFRSRFQRTGDLTDIFNAISTHQRALQLTSNDHADMAGRLDDLGYSFRCRFESTGDMPDISSAILTHHKCLELTPDGHADMAGRLDNLACSFRCRFERTGDMRDISSAISTHQRALQLTPDGHADMATRLDNLGYSFRCRFESTGDMPDIFNAISTHERALQLTPDGHPDAPAQLKNLGTSFMRRFQRTGDLPDISNAISTHQKAVQLTQDDHAEMPHRLSSLGNSFSCRFERTGDLADISNAISAHQRAVQLTPEGHADMPGWRSNLGISFMCRFERTGDLPDISSAISAFEEAIQITPDGHASMPRWLNNLGGSFIHRFERTGDLTDISGAISAHEKALQLTPNGHADMASRLSNLATSFDFRFDRTGEPADIHQAISYYRRSATWTSGAPSIRFESARHWANLSANHNPSQCLHAFDATLDLLSRIAGIDRTINQRHTSLIDISEFTAYAASTAIVHGEVAKAVEWLEHGRCLVWNQLNQLRTPVDTLRSHDKSLADRFLDVSRALESSGSRRASTVFSLDATLSEQIASEDEALAHVKRAEEWAELLEEIRSTPGFHEFLRPREVSDILKGLPPDGPVVIINVDNVDIDRCDAIALIPGRDKPLHIPLDKFTYQDALKLRGRLHAILSSHGCRMRDSGVDRAGRPIPKPGTQTKSDIHVVLEKLWLCVVKPILDALAYSVSFFVNSCGENIISFIIDLQPNPSNPGRIWWCATGPLAFLPIHAAGIYGQDIQSSGSCVSDFVVSSYTPTVSILLDKTKAAGVKGPPSFKVLLVSQPNTPGLPPIPATTREIDIVAQKIGTESLRLESSVATVNRVGEEMGSHGWVHFACHASQDTNNPLSSGFSLHDGRLELSELMKQRIPQCELAFLSACQTSTGDEKLSEEAVHLAAGMLAVGYQGVVATTWSIKDSCAPKVAEAFYDYLMTGHARLDSINAAYALHHAMQVIRKEVGDTEDGLLTWIPYVHFGL